MFKKILFSISLITVTFFVSGQNLYMIKFSGNDLKSFQNEKSFKIHYYNNQLLIGSGFLEEKYNDKIIEKNTSISTNEYFLVKLNLTGKADYVDEIKKTSEIVYSDFHNLIIRTSKEKIQHLRPAIHNGIVRINNVIVKTDYKEHDFSKAVVYDQFVADRVSDVNIDSVMADIQHMENYGTRVYNTSEAIQAQNWIKAQFESYGLDVNLSSTGAGGSQNVTAIQTGLVYPNQYIVVGGHYDSASYGSLAPGADDNASGTAAVLEIARILSNYQFNYSIIYCAWSAEEIGLYGSSAWASNASNSGMDIIGYLNIDMTGYLYPGDDLHTDMVAPGSAQLLADFYKEIVDVYISYFYVYDGNLTAGDSDHTSFNNNGYMGIFPCEEDNNYSPYIHSEDDKIGLSVNSSEKAEKFTQAGVAFIAAGAVPFTGFYPPMNLTLTQLESQIQLNWEAPLNTSKGFSEYRLYRNGILYANIANVNQLSYTDSNVQNGETYEYYITAAYTGTETGESSPSNTVSVTMGLNQIYLWDFEDGTQGWTIQNDAYGWRWGVPVDITGNNTEYLSIDSDAPGSSYHVFDYAISPLLNLSSYSVAFVEFDYGFRDYSTDYLKFMYRTSPASNWVEVENIIPSNSFAEHLIELPVESLTNEMQFTFYYDDDNVWAWYAAIDNVGISAAQTSSVKKLPDLSGNINIYPNPIRDFSKIEITTSKADNYTVVCCDFTGKEISIIYKGEIKQGKSSFDINTSNLKSGIYFIKAESKSNNFSGKIVVIK